MWCIYWKIGIRYKNSKIQNNVDDILIFSWTAKFSFFLCFFSLQQKMHPEWFYHFSLTTTNEQKSLKFFDFVTSWLSRKHENFLTLVWEGEKLGCISRYFRYADWGVKKDTLNKCLVLKAFWTNTKRTIFQAFFYLKI